MADNYVRFCFLTQSEYDNLNNKDNRTLYFTSDTNRIYKGQILYGKSMSKLTWGDNVYDGSQDVNIDEYDGFYNVFIE